MNDYVLMMKPRKILNSGGNLFRRMERGSFKVTADCCPVSPGSLDGAGVRGGFRTEAGVCVPVPVSCCMAETVQHGGASILQLKMHF